MTEVKREDWQRMLILQNISEQPVELEPLVRREHLVLPEPSLADNRADRERLLAGLVEHYKEVEIPFALLPRLGEALRAGNWQVTVYLGRSNKGWRVIAVNPGHETAPYYGLVIDIGTTTVVVYLINMLNGCVEQYAAGYNEQGLWGEDILTRIQVAVEGEGLVLLRQAIINTLIRLVDEVCRRQVIQPGEIMAVVVGANTTMIHLFLGLNPARICLAPYIPVCYSPGFLTAEEVFLPVHKQGVVYCFPAVASYVGGDVVAGVLASGLLDSSEVGLFVDIGTNGEIVLGNKEWLVACAGAAGPALEGGVARAGIRAEPGAIDRVEIDPITWQVTYRTIGDLPARGICGSGLVDCVAGLFLAGIIDRSGRFRHGQDYFVIVPAAETAHGEDIVITQTDINNLMRTKGAVNAAVDYLLESVGLDYQSIQRFYAAGAFGQYLDLESAITIGLYPDLPRSQMYRLGNACASGGRLALLSERMRQRAEEIARSITYFELNASDVFMQKFVGSRFIPHTNIDLYPTVKRKLEEIGKRRT